MQFNTPYGVADDQSASYFCGLQEGLAIGAITGGVNKSQGGKKGGIDNILDGAGGLLQTALPIFKTKKIELSYPTTRFYYMPYDIAISFLTQVAESVPSLNANIGEFTNEDGLTVIGICFSLKNGSIIIIGFVKSQVDEEYIARADIFTINIYESYNAFVTAYLPRGTYITGNSGNTRYFSLVDGVATITLEVGYIEENIPLLGFGHYLSGTTNACLFSAIDIDENICSFTSGSYGLNMYGKNSDSVFGKLSAGFYNAAGGYPGDIYSFPTALQNNFNAVLPTTLSTYDMETYAPYCLYGGVRLYPRKLLHRYYNSSILLVFFEPDGGDGFLGQVVCNDLFILGKISSEYIGNIISPSTSDI